MRARLPVGNEMMICDLELSDLKGDTKSLTPQKRQKTFPVTFHKLLSPYLKTKKVSDPGYLIESAYQKSVVKILTH